MLNEKNWKNWEWPVYVKFYIDSLDSDELTDEVWANIKRIIRHGFMATEASDEYFEYLNEADRQVEWLRKLNAVVT